MSSPDSKIDYETGESDSTFGPIVRKTPLQAFTEGVFAEVYEERDEFFPVPREGDIIQVSYFAFGDEAGPVDVEVQPAQVRL